MRPARMRTGDKADAREISAAEDEQVGIAGGVEQCVCGKVANDAPFDVRSSILGEGAFDECVERLSRGGFGVVRIER